MMCVLAALPCLPCGGAAYASGTNVLTDIRHWSAPTYTRIVLDLKQEAAFKSFKLNNPARIVVDVSGVVPKVPRDLLVINDKIVRQVRAAGNGSDRVRIVLDLDQQAEHTIFSLGQLMPSRPGLSLMFLGRILKRLIGPGASRPANQCSRVLELWLLMPVMGVKTRVPWAGAGFMKKILYWLFHAVW